MCHSLKKVSKSHWSPQSVVPTYQERGLDSLRGDTLGVLLRTWLIFCKNSDYRKLERLQERALRTIYRSHSESYEELLGRAKLPTLYNRRLQDTAVLMYKVKFGLTPTCISDLFARKNSTYALRKSDFELTRFNTIRYGKHSIRYMGPFLWSKLPKDLKESPNVTTFRNKIRKLDLSGYLSNNSNCCNLCGQ